MKQWHCTVNGQQYGPMDEAQLRQWIAESRVTAADMVWSEGMDAWRPAADVLDLGATPPSGPPPAAAAPAPFAASGVRKSDRGTLILVLGILSLTVCAFCGLPAWIMGKRDLAEMDAGIMDASNRGTTMAGYVCGIIGSILMMLGVVMMILYFIFILLVVGAGTISHP